MKQHSCKLQVVKDASETKADGIIGMDFLTNRALIDCVKNSVKFLGISIAEKIMIKSGYQEGRGLAKKLQGRVSPVQLHTQNNRHLVSTNNQRPSNQMSEARWSPGEAVESDIIYTRSKL